MMDVGFLPSLWRHIVDLEMGRPRSGHALFPSGELIASKGAIDALTSEEAWALLCRHQAADHGRVSPDVAAANRIAVSGAAPARIRSMFVTSTYATVYVYTSAGCEITVFFQPHEAAEAQALLMKAETS